MSKHHRRPPRDDDRDPHKKKHFDRKARRGQRPRGPNTRMGSPSPDGEDFESSLSEGEFDETFGSEDEEEDFFNDDEDPDTDEFDR